MEHPTPPAPDQPEDAHAFTRAFRRRFEEGLKTLQGLAPKKDVLNFEELYAEEARHLEVSRKADAAASPPPDAGEPQVRSSPAGEPAVYFTPHDRFGLALSGGGIRSATFNLGLLQALARLNVLRHVDYLATVSGGGYVGGFWTTWLHRQGQRTGVARFPLGNDRRGGERAEVRHLREFSRFLLPRVGVLQTEFWGIVMTILGGMLPSMLAALAVLVIGWYLWVFGLMALSLPTWKGESVTGVALLLYLAVAEIKWRNAGRAEPNAIETRSYAVVAAGAAVLVFCLVRFFLVARGHAPDFDAWLSFTKPATALAVPQVLGMCTLVLLVARLAAARVFRSPDKISVVAGLERCATRLVGITTGMLALAGLWLGAGKLDAVAGDLGLKVTAGGAAVSAGIFAWAKKWLMQPVQETRGGTFMQFAWNWLKRATPKALALLVWLLLFVLVGVGMHRWGAASWSMFDERFWWPLGAALGVIALVAWLFDPARVGMHDFYRSRIARCYLGASNISPLGSEAERAARNRQVAERPDDDLTLGQLRDVARPIHLVCVAANDMSGDPLVNLYRGARSAVLSGNGISLGDRTARLDDLRLSSALTASAAAFNSQMGRVSMDLGPAVGFLMSALNLRLGLWVPHPENRYRGSYAFPGRFFLAELLGISHTEGRNLHLSDGNHFENFGLYELVRRHCRYIIVSDCGADPDVAFDDLANVLRRVREDFGVEIDLDIAPLRPDANRRARQHAVVGTIHYNGAAGLDKGTILFFKPALTGDEPPDVLQYSTRNGDFPHESTGDQFYDEAQWESYRRLGEHAVDTVLGFFDAARFSDRNAPDRLFRDARSRWHPAPENHHQSFLAMSERCASLEQDLMSSGPECLRREFFPEATALAALAPQSEPAVEGKKSSAKDVKTDLQVLGYLTRVGQIMEDIWVGTELERYWSHPLNEGWMNYFRRWTATPSFRRWWPVIASLYSVGLREFVGKRFCIGAVDPESTRGRVSGDRLAQLHLREVDDPQKFFAESYVAGQFLQTRPAPQWAKARVFAYDLQLLAYEGGLGEEKLPVGFAVVHEERMADGESGEAWAAVWDVDELFVPDPLYGAGFVSKLLDALLRFLRSPERAGRTYREARVNFVSGISAVEKAQPAVPAQRPDAAIRYERVREIEFYQSRGFSYVRAEDPKTGAVTLRTIFR